MTGWLARWSARKTDADPVPAAAPVARAMENTSADLPRLEDLTPESDVTAFLAREVPAVLRNAALRKMWLMDPNIRDYVGPARDYAYDWSVPGGVPGGGPLDAATDVPRLVARLFGDARDDAPPGDAATTISPSIQPDDPGPPKPEEV